MQKKKKKKTGEQECVKTEMSVKGGWYKITGECVLHAESVKNEVVITLKSST